MANGPCFLLFCCIIRSNPQSTNTLALSFYVCRFLSFLFSVLTQLRFVITAVLARYLYLVIKHAATMFYNHESKSPPPSLVTRYEAYYYQFLPPTNMASPPSGKSSHQ